MLAGIVSDRRLTFVAASALACGQSNGKKILAYSTIANLGLIIACAGMATPAAITAAHPAHHLPRGFQGPPLPLRGHHRTAHRLA